MHEKSRPRAALSFVVDRCLIGYPENSGRPKSSFLVLQSASRPASGKVVGVDAPDTSGIVVALGRRIRWLVGRVRSGEHSVGGSVVVAVE
jgi:hypothetical protein